MTCPNHASRDRPPVATRRLLLRTGSVAAALALAASSLAIVPDASAQAWPTKQIRIVVGFPAGSTTDSIARVIAEHMRARLGQPVIVENRAGANGSIGVAEVARAPADGYTILATNSSSITVNPQIYRKISYAPERDFIPLTMVVSAPFILDVNPANERTASVNTVADLVALARARPGELTYSSGGPGNLAHLAFAMLSNRAGVTTTHVPYKGGVAGQVGLLAKEVDAMFDTPVGVPHIKAGKLRALAVTTPQRWRDLPGVPTMIESGYPGFDVSFWLGLLVPARTPQPIVQALYDAVKSVRDDANAVRQLEAHGDLELMDPQAFAARIRTETAAWGEVIRRENIQID
jgi:tripartite-type tricarboxylate transporter receptor subunit TctC